MRYVRSQNNSDMDVSPSDMMKTGAGYRIMLYSHDTFGLGHLNRNLKIATALRSRFPEISILLVTGSPQVQRFRLPRGVDYVKLPAVHKVGDEGYMPRYLDISFKRALAIRTRIILETVREYAPDILLVDHSPLGMKKEILPSLEWIRDSGVETKSMLGLRDIYDDPWSTKKRWAEQKVFEVMRDLYDRIFIYGAPAIFDPISEYDFPEDVKSKTAFCGYITDFGGDLETDPDVQRENLVLVTIGGGDGGELLIENFLKSLHLKQNYNQFKSIILTGPFLEQEIWDRYRKEADELGVKILRCISEVRRLMKRSRLVLSTGGYNTVTDIMCHADRALIVPRILFREEQLIRAQKFSNMGYLKYLHPSEATPERLNEVMIEMLNERDSSLSRFRENGGQVLNGGTRLSELLGETLARFEKARGNTR